MQFSGAVALVTDANRRLGRRLTEQLFDRGAKVYAARNPPRSLSRASRRFTSTSTTPNPLPQRLLSPVTSPAAILNVVSVLSWVDPGSPAYASAKTALWAQTDGIREELAPRDVAGQLSTAAMLASTTNDGRHAFQAIDDQETTW